MEKSKGKNKRRKRTDNFKLKREVLMSNAEQMAATPGSLNEFDCFFGITRLNNNNNNEIGSSLE